MMRVECANREDAVAIYRYLQTLAIHKVGKHNVVRVSDSAFDVDAPDCVVPAMMRAVEARFRKEVRK
jgi:hypothetical protein